MSFFSNDERVEFFPEPEPRVGGNSTRVLQTVLEGASFKILRPVRFNRILVRVTAFVAGGTMKFLIYQRPPGWGADASPASRVATVSAFAPGGTGNFQMTPSEGEVRLASGVYYVLMGRDSGAGSITLRTYTITSLDLSNANVESNTHVTNYDTALLASTTPATFDPRPVATGQATPSIADVCPIHRLIRV
jgi:hypothetical protein